MTPAPELVQRFKADLERLIGTPDRLGIAVSGGPDSLALLLLATAAVPGQVEVATVDHNLRAESAGEAAFVADICGDLGCPHSTLDVVVPNRKAGLQAEARRARYAALAGWALERGINVLLTAHHADDQTETLLMRLQRGSGIGGLAGVRAVRAEGALRIVRPLLGWTKAELEAVVADAGLIAVDDPSNRDTRFDRAAMRGFLAANPQFEAKRLARTAAALAEAEEALDWYARRLFNERCRKEGGEWRIDPEGLPRELKRRLLRLVIARLHEAHSLTPAWAGSEDVEGLLTALERGEAATLSGVAARGGSLWRLYPAPPRRSVSKAS
ncbi:MAG TPA: tRNA lysidine(34) synthetase TilS [Allosphingosinicella sp.]|uniref:tRNA lysidine(34) synthetase TilS n=1 Tax=Allosphingosinicella sp. TaxID=2823234 RepID=UPI002EDAAF46